ncbi:MAG: hypothetical protein IKE30_10195, partial [Clostridia bacterium]|nr:hypothetical protein [Clostridia bacterium]
RARPVGDKASRKRAEQRSGRSKAEARDYCEADRSAEGARSPLRLFRRGGFAGPRSHFCEGSLPPRAKMVSLQIFRPHPKDAGKSEKRLGILQAGFQAKRTK